MPRYIPYNLFLVFIELLKSVAWHFCQFAEIFGHCLFKYCFCSSTCSNIIHVRPFHCVPYICYFLSIQFSCSVMSNSLQSHKLQHTRPPCPSPTPGIYPNSFPLSRWCHPTISSSVIPFSSHLQSFPASGSFQMSQLFASGGQSIGVSALVSVLPMNIQDWFPLGWTGWISLQMPGLDELNQNL